MPGIGRGALAPGVASPALGARNPALSVRESGHRPPFSKRAGPARSVRLHRLRNRIPEAHVQQIPSIDRCDREAELGDFRVGKMRLQMRERFVARVRVRNPRDAFRPLQRGALAGVEEGRLAPAGDRVQMPLVDAELHEIAPVHVDAVRAAVDLRDAQKHQIDEWLAERAAPHGFGQMEQRVERLRCEFRIRKAGGVCHGRFPLKAGRPMRPSRLQDAAGPAFVTARRARGRSAGCGAKSSAVWTRVRPAMHAVPCAAWKRRGVEGPWLGVYRRDEVMRRRRATGREEAGRARCPETGTDRAASAEAPWRRAEKDRALKRRRVIRRGACRVARCGGAAAGGARAGRGASRVPGAPARARRATRVTPGGSEYARACPDCAPRRSRRSARRRWRTPVPIRSARR
ncbi:hypothetical protein DP43_5189 [Burkholderia pseudomallei]|nr:hypothetical protein DP43_5189 [Burkholderia pseudomallei]